MLLFMCISMIPPNGRIQELARGCRNQNLGPALPFDRAGCPFVERSVAPMAERGPWQYGTVDIESSKRFDCVATAHQARYADGTAEQGICDSPNGYL